MARLLAGAAACFLLLTGAFHFWQSRAVENPTFSSREDDQQVPRRGRGSQRMADGRRIRDDRPSAAEASTLQLLIKKSVSR